VLTTAVPATKCLRPTPSSRVERRLAADAKTRPTQVICRATMAPLYSGPRNTGTAHGTTTAPPPYSRAKPAVAATTSLSSPPMVEESRLDAAGNRIVASEFGRIRRGLVRRADAA
jgi:hypothetical protein